MFSYISHFHVNRWSQHFFLVQTYHNILFPKVNKIQIIRNFSPSYQELHFFSSIHKNLDMVKNHVFYLLKTPTEYIVNLHGKIDIFEEEKKLIYIVTICKRFLTLMQKG